LRLEIGLNSDKKKSELYFSAPVKKFLTKKPKQACPQVSQNISNAELHLLSHLHSYFLSCNRCNIFVRPRLNMSRIFIAVVFLTSAVSITRAADELNPPFGFRWNDPMSRVEAVLKGAKANIVKREKVENREVWTVEGLVHPGLKRTLFTFKGGSLFGVELQYEYPDWSIERYNERMGEIRRYFDAKYGTGKLVSRTHDSDSEDVVQTLVGYQWTIGATMLELFYFSAQHDQLVYRTISVDYKAL
jgi:hypothetical protein